MRRRPVVLLSLLVAFLLAGPAGAVASSTSPYHSPYQRIRVLTLNLFYGGDDLDLATGDFCAVPDGCAQTLRQIERLIRSSRADVVGVQESERNTERIATALGWYGSNQAHVMSRFPIINPPGANGLYVFVEVAPGRVVAVANTHLPSDPYGPYLVRDGGSRADVLALERQVRLPAVQSLTEELPKLASRGIPVLLTGDFNSPSHLDWTPAAARVRPDVPYPVAWPASAALAAAGLKDTYREVHPDPVAVPGFTWTPGSPEADPHEVFDRIDWVLRDGPSRTIDSQVVGETGGPDVGIGLSPYPTDHRGVVSTVEVRAAVPPVLVSPATRRVTVGEALAVTYHSLAHRSTKLALVDGTGRRLAGQRVRAGDGSASFSTRGLARGRYDVVLISGHRVVSRSPIWAYPAGEPTTVSVDRPSYRVGAAIGVHWANAPGMGLDWVSVFRCPTSGCEDTSQYLAYTYTKSSIEGSGSIGADSIEGITSWPLPAGRYVVRLLPDDGLRSVAQSAPFTIS